LNPTAWHIHLYRPAENGCAPAGTALVVWGVSLTTRKVDPNVLSSRFASSFEQAVAELQQLERMYVELDGSFVWRGQWPQHSPQHLTEGQPPDTPDTPEPPWQLDGMLYDHAGHIQRVELKGDAPLFVWEQLLAVFGWPQQPLLAHLVDHQCWLDINQLLLALNKPNRFPH